MSLRSTWKITNYTAFDIHFVELAMCFESFYNVRGVMRHTDSHCANWIRQLRKMHKTRFNWNIIIQISFFKTRVLSEMKDFRFGQGVLDIDAVMIITIMKRKVWNIYTYTWCRVFREKRHYLSYWKCEIKINIYMFMLFRRMPWNNFSAIKNVLSFI